MGARRKSKLYPFAPYAQLFEKLFTGAKVGREGVGRKNILWNRPQMYTKRYRKQNHKSKKEIEIQITILHACLKIVLCCYFSLNWIDFQKIDALNHQNSKIIYFHFVILSFYSNIDSKSSNNIYLNIIEILFLFLFFISCKNNMECKIW